MVEHLEYDVRAQEVKYSSMADHVSGVVGKLLHSSDRERDATYQPPERISPVAAEQRVSRLPIERTLDPAEADGIVTMPLHLPRASINNPWDTVDDRDLKAALRPMGNGFKLQVAAAQRARLQKIDTAQWWTKLDDKRHTIRNPFDSEPTEQYVITVPDNDDIPELFQDLLGWEGGSVSVYNFSEPLSDDTLRGIVNAVGTYAQITRGTSLRAVPYILTHDYLTPALLGRSQRLAAPAGLSRLGLPFIELNARSIQDEEMALKTTAHEITHQRKGMSDFARFFIYNDIDGDGDYDTTTTLCGSQCAGGHVCGLTLNPASDYALTSPIEDLAMSAEDVLFGKPIDSFRRDAVITILQASLNGKSIVCDRDPEPWTIERRTGRNIVLPTIDPKLLNTPIKLYFTDQAARE